MAMISYAQNFEDVVLMRALQDVKEGFYIDVGAFSPDFHSVTKAFYERGWRGVNIEPNPECEAHFKSNRPRDINLAVGVGDKPGRMRLNVFSDTGLSTLDDSIAGGHVSTGRSSASREVQIVTLNDVFRDHVGPQTAVHFAKIDVEGFEMQVVQGNDWTANRPWIVLVEATLPLTQVATYMSWEPILLAARYVHAYSDGLNRFYVAEEHQELIAKLAVPPNVFDEFKTILQVEAEQQRDRAAEALRESTALRQAAESAVAEQARRAQAELDRLQSGMNRQVTQLNATIGEFDARLQQVATELHSVYHSRSWRVSYPLRLGSLVIQDAMNGLPATRGAVRRLARHAMGASARRASRLLRRNPLIHAHAQAWLRARPALAYRVQRLLSGDTNGADGIPGMGLRRTRFHSLSVAELPKGAREIYFALREAIDRKRQK